MTVSTGNVDISSGNGHNLAWENGELPVWGCVLRPGRHQEGKAEEVQYEPIGWHEGHEAKERKGL
jgi:hypothetical protein